MNLMDIMRSRRSVRKFNSTLVPSDETLKTLIEAAITAPSPGNRQPWKFKMLRDRILIGTTVDIVRARSAEISRHLPESLRPAFSEYASNFSAFVSAPVLLVPLYKIHSTLSSALERDVSADITESLRRVERDSALISISAAIQNLMLMAHEMGLATCCMTGPLLAAKDIRAVLGVPRGWEIAALLPVGHAEVLPEGPGRKPTEAFIIQ